MTNNEHGANLFELARSHGYSLNEMSDFSSNINPFGLSDQALEALQHANQFISLYPDPNYTDLLAAISDYIQIPADQILLGSGVTHLIRTCIEAVKPVRGWIQKPAYSEFEKELRRMGADLSVYYLQAKREFVPDLEAIIDQIQQEQCDIIVLCNPNNPTAGAFSLEELTKLLTSTDAQIMIDETYIEFSPTIQSAVSLCKSHENLIVIRGTSKFFATPGIRLAYAVTSNQKLQAAMQTASHLWGINIFADQLGQAMFTDYDYQQRVKKAINQQHDYMMNSLSEIPAIYVYPSQTNFILMEIRSASLTAQSLRSKLIKQKMIIRDCASFEGLSPYFFRICLLTPAENQRLLEALQSILKEY